MNKKESLVEDTFIQLKNLEDVIAENAQGILASTMKQEIKELVKESLNEQEDEDEIELDAEVDTDADNDEMDMDMDMDFEDDEMDVNTDMDFDDEDMDMDIDMDVDDDTIDLTGASDEEILRVFKAMGDEDGIIVKKDGGMLHLSDDNEDVEYMVQLGESDDEMELDEMYDEEEDEMEETEMYEEEDEMEDEESEGVIYELELDDMGNDMDFEDEEMDFEDEEMDFEDEKYKTPSRRLKPIDSKYFDMTEEDEYVMESSKFKSKGVGMGSASKFKYDKKPNQGEGFKTKMKQGTRGVGMGKAKFEYKEEVNTGKVGKKPMVKKVETKEASRTLGNGKRWGRNGLDKPKAAPRHLRVESTEVELNLLREKNEEYRKALNLFRTKLNEVATFNSNLAYATRLFTEHSTTKQEKINILRRFDSVDTLKESKNLYKSIKNELSSTSTTDNTITESLERNVVKTPSSGSAMNLIESKTYENPQFLRMKDLMGKLK
jgi:hypothetical protein